MAENALELRQGQGLAMTQQLRQSIHLLQLSTTELQQVIEEELEKNPLLTREGDEDGGDVSGTDVVEGGNAVIDTETTVTQNMNDASEKLDMAEMSVWGEEESVSQLYSERYTENTDGATSMYQGMQSLSDEIEQRVSEQKNLHELLLEQVSMMVSSELELKMAEVIIDMVDAAGYLPADIEARAGQLGLDEAMLADIIHYVQCCEPTGVGARSLKECIALQLIERDQMNDAMEILLEHLDDIAAGNHKKLCKLCQVDMDELSAMFALIRACNPKPASHLEATISQTLIPEVFVRKGKDASWLVELNQDVLPRVLLNKQYSIRLKDGVRHKADLKVINEHVNNANWLMKALYQRNATLLKVASEIVRQQEDFFAFGVQYLKPMTLKDIAAELGCHESTVSRITSNKYLSCERGIFELKYFFNATLNNANGGTAYSSRTVMHMIKTIIDAETADNILSDDAITEILNQRGIDVARRTVVKYRKHSAIPSSVERRRQKKLAFS